jgi:hypothetical protein
MGVGRVACGEWGVKGMVALAAQVRALPHMRFQPFLRSARPRLGPLFLVSVGCVALMWACSSTPEKAAVADPKTPQGARAIEHEKCDESAGRVQMLDANNDGKPDIKRVFDKTSGHEVCRIADLNHDGKADMYEYYNADGSLRRRETAYDNSDAISEILTFEDGKLVKRERDTTGQHKIDTWDTYDPATGKIVKRERDINGNGKVAEWWTWEGDKVTIAVDKNGDGKPDPGDTIVLGPNGQAIAPAPSATAATTGDAGVANVPPPPPPPVIMPQGTAPASTAAPKRKGPAKK